MILFTKNKKIFTGFQRIRAECQITIRQKKCRKESHVTSNYETPK